MALPSQQIPPQAMDVDGLNPLFARAEVITELLNYGNPSEFAEEVVDLLREEVASLITRFDQAYWLAEDAEDPLVGELDQAIEALGSAVGHFFGPASGSSVVTDDETERVRVLSVQHADSAGTPGLVNPATVASRSTNNAIVGVELALDIHHIELTSRITVVPVPGTDAYEEAIFNEGIQDIMADAIKQVDEELRRESQDVLDRKLAEACLFFDHIEDPLHHAMLQLKSAGSDSRPFFVFVVPERSFYCVDALRAKARTLGAQLGIAHCTLELELCFAVREQLVPVNGNWETTMWVNKVYEDEKGKLLCLTTDHPVGPRTLELKIEDLVGPFPRNAEQPTAVMMEDPEDFTRRGNGGLVKDSEGLAQVGESYSEYRMLHVYARSAIMFWPEVRGQEVLEATKARKLKPATQSNAQEPGIWGQGLSIPQAASTQAAPTQHLGRSHAGSIRTRSRSAYLQGAEHSSALGVRP